MEKQEGKPDVFYDIVSALVKFVDDTDKQQNGGNLEKDVALAEKVLSETRARQ